MDKHPVSKLKDGISMLPPENQMPAKAIDKFIVRRFGSREAFEKHVVKNKCGRKQ
jgi:hypothetical protein